MSHTQSIRAVLGYNYIKRTESFQEALSIDARIRYFGNDGVGPDLETFKQCRKIGMPRTCRNPVVGRWYCYLCILRYVLSRFTSAMSVAVPFSAHVQREKLPVPW